MGNSFEQPIQAESPEQKNARFAEGLITENEIRECWERPDKPIFEHTVKKGEEGKEQEMKFRVQVLSENLKDDLLAELKNSWDKPTFEELKETLELFFEQKKIGHPALLNVEYYVTVDSENNPFVITGIYTDDIYGGAGFATKDKLDSQNHYLATRLGWFSVSKDYQGAGVGGFLFDWVEKMAKSRGSKFMVAETDDFEKEDSKPTHLTKEKNWLAFSTHAVKRFLPKRNCLPNTKQVKGKEKKCIDTRDLVEYQKIQKE